MNEEQKQKLILNIVQFYNLFQKEFLDSMPDNNNPELSPLLFKILNEIHFTGTITSSSISKRLSISIPNTSRNINKLAELGYIHKNKDKDDKRITHLTLSQKGLNLIINSNISTEEILFDKFDVLSSQELEELSESFSSIKGLLIKMRDSKK